MIDTNTLLGLTQAVTGLFALVAASTGFITWISWRISPLEINFTEHRNVLGYSVWSARVKTFRNISNRQELYVCGQRKDLLIHRARITDGPGGWGLVDIAPLPNGAIKVGIDILRNKALFSFRIVADADLSPMILNISAKTYWSMAIGRFFRVLLLEHLLLPRFVFFPFVLRFCF